MPLSPFSKIDIINQALIEIGEAPIESIAAGGDIGEAAGIIYDSSLSAILSDCKWRFASVQTSLARVNTEGTTNYKNAFALPNDMLYLQKTPDYAYDYEIFGDYFYTNKAEVLINYTRVVEEAEFPAYFVYAFKLQLAADLAMTVTRSEATTQRVLQLAELALRRAKNLDSSQRPSQPFLRNSRYTGVRI